MTIPKNPTRILIIRTDRIGDVVLTTPALKAIRQAYSHAHVTLMVSPLTKDLVEGHPYINDLIIDDQLGLYRGFIGFLQLCRKIRQGQYDVAVILHTKNRYNWACFLAGVPCRIAYKNEKGGFLLTDPIHDERSLGYKHESEYCMDVAVHLGAKPLELTPSIVQSPQAESWANQWFKEHVPDSFQLIVLHPGASDQTKCWPIENFIALPDKLSNVYLTKIAIIGSGPTSLLAKEIIKKSRVPVLDLTDQCTLAQTAALLRRSTLLISNDSGPVHVAAAVGCMVVNLFLRNQPGINAKRWQPLAKQAITLINKDEDAVIVNKDSQMIGGNKSSISVDTVLSAVDDLMRRNVQSTFLY